MDKEKDSGAEEEPFLQRLYDRPFVLLGLGMGSMLAFYTLWGWWELAHMPVSTLP
jgi:hypothetical protein